MAIDPDDIASWREDVGRRLRLLRMVVDMDQIPFAKSVGIKQSRWSSYERGARMLTLAAARALRETYGVSLDWIYLGDPSGWPYRMHEKLAAVHKIQRKRN